MKRARTLTAATAAAALTLSLAVSGCSVGRLGEVLTTGQPEQATATGIAVKKPTASARSTVPKKPAATAGGTVLEKYVAAARTKLPSIMDLADGMYSRIDIQAKNPDTLVYVYVFAQTVSPGLAQSRAEGMQSTLQSVADSMIFPEMKQAGIAHPKVRYTYYNPDHSLIWTHTFTSS